MKRLNSIVLTLSLIATSIGPLAHASETITYYHLDAQGSPIAATDQQGNVIWTEHYQPYGQRIDQSPQAQTNSRWYTGHPQDEDTGLTYMGARYYDPAIGRFMAIDPQDFSENNLHSFNRYAYGNNNPYKYFDPNGKEALFIFTEPPIGMRPLLEPVAEGLVKSTTEVTAPTSGRLQPIKDAEGPHTTWKTEAETGKITRHETWEPNARNPSGWDKTQSTDVTGRPHFNKQTGESVPTPHTQGKNIPGGVRPAKPEEIPKGPHGNDKQP